MLHEIFCPPKIHHRSYIADNDSKAAIGIIVDGGKAAIGAAHHLYLIYAVRPNTAFPHISKPYNNPTYSFAPAKPYPNSFH